MLWKRHLNIYQDPIPSLVNIYSRPFQSKKHSKTSAISPIAKSKQIGNLELINHESTNSHNKKPKTIYLSKGNNHILVKQQFLLNGIKDTFSKQQAQIIWVQRSQQIRNIPSSCILINFLENHESLTNKQKLYRNLMKYNGGLQQNKKYIPDTYIIDFKIDTENGFIQFLQRYFSNKNGKIKLKRLQQRGSQFHIYNCYGDVRIPFKKINHQHQQKNINLWILKPTSLNRGQGIHIFSNLKQLKNIINQDNYQLSIRMYQDTQMPSTYIIQQYIEKPLLIQGYKFDIRIWALVIMDKYKKLKTYMFDQGYIRLAGTQYKSMFDNQQEEEEEQDKGQKNQSPKLGLKASLKTSKNQENQKIITNRYMHLTNNAVQKNSKTYGILYEGNQLSMKQMEEYFQGKISLSDLKTSMKNIIIDTISSVKDKLGVFESRKGLRNLQQFQLFGYDFLLDHTGKPWLLEVNCNPCLQESSKLVSKLLKQMLNQMISLLQINRNQQTKQTIKISKKRRSIMKDIEQGKKSANSYRKFSSKDIVRSSSQIQHPKQQTLPINKQTILDSIPQTPQKSINSFISPKKWVRLI